MVVSEIMGVFLLCLLDVGLISTFHVLMSLRNQYTHTHMSVCTLIVLYLPIQLEICCSKCDVWPE